MEYPADDGYNCGGARRLDAWKPRLCGRKRAGGEQRGAGGVREGGEVILPPSKYRSFLYSALAFTAS